MPRFWIVSANVNRRRTTLRPWISTILANETAYMGWAKDDPKGAIFADIAPGDFVLIAHGTLIKHGSRRRLVACGKVKLNKPTSDPRVRGLRHSQFAQLDPFLDLPEDPTDCGISLKDTLYDNSPQPPAVFELNPDDPKHQGNRDICVWLEKRLGKKLNSTETMAKPKSRRVTANTVGTNNEANTEEHEVKTRKQIIKALHRENKLVKEFRRALRRRGRETTKLRYLAGSYPLYCDVYEPKKKHLIEAKGSISREDIRMAIGQLFDYDRLTRAADLGDSKLAILVPERPNDDIEELLDSIDIALIWKQGRAFSDNRRGDFI